METFCWAGWWDEAKKKSRWREAGWKKPILDPLKRETLILMQKKKLYDKDTSYN